MNEILKLLAGGDLRSDGDADDVAKMVIGEPDLLSNLIEGFESGNEVIRMRTAHAVEVISRKNHNLLNESALKSKLIKYANEDGLPETQWHLAQVFGNIALSDEEVGMVLPVLYRYLKNGTVLVRAWTIVGLGSIAAKSGVHKGEIVKKITALQSDVSPAVRKRVAQVLGKLTN